VYTVHYLSHAQHTVCCVYYAELWKLEFKQAVAFVAADIVKFVIVQKIDNLFRVSLVNQVVVPAVHSVS